MAAFSVCVFLEAATAEEEGGTCLALRWRGGAKRRAELFVAAQEAEADDEEALRWDNEDKGGNGGNKEREACGLRCFMGTDAVALFDARP